MTSVDLPALGRPTMATRMGRARSPRSSSASPSRHRLRCDRLQAERRQHVGREIAHALAVLGRDGDRLAEPQLEGLVEAFRARRAPRTCWRPERRAGPTSARACANAVSAAITPSRASSTNSTRSAARDRRFALLCACASAIEPRRASSRPAVSTSVTVWPDKLRLALAPVAREARHVGDERRARASQPVEQRRLADVGPADDCDDWNWGGQRQGIAMGGLGQTTAALTLLACATSQVRVSSVNSS